MKIEKALKKPLLFSINLFLMIFAVAVHANSTTTTHSLKNIHQEVIDYLNGQLQYSDSIEKQIKIRHLDKRLKLSQCASPLQIALAKGQNISNVSAIKVKCSLPKPWAITVPVSIKLFKDVIVTTVPLPRGRIIQAEDLQYARLDIKALHQGYFTSMSEAVGKEVAKTLNHGQVVTKKYLQNPIVIKKGAKVKIIAKLKKIQVESDGKAKENGRLHEQIAVENLNSKKIIYATVKDSQTVEIIIR